MHQLQPRADLYDQVLNRIRDEQRLSKLRSRIYWYAAAFVASACAFIPFFERFYSEMIRSGFIYFLRLGWSDFSVVADNFTDFSLTLMESLPIVWFLIVAGFSLTAVASLVKFFNSAYEIRQLHRRLTH